MTQTRHGAHALHTNLPTHPPTCSLSRTMSSSTSVVEGRYRVPQARPMDSCTTVVVLVTTPVASSTSARVMLMWLSQALPTVQLQFEARHAENGWRKR